MKKSIAILLPYKEKYTLNDAAAASIWVKDYLKKTKLKKQTIVFGNLSEKYKPLTDNFINIDCFIHFFFICKNYSKNIVQKNDAWILIYKFFA